MKRPTSVKWAMAILLFMGIFAFLATTATPHELSPLANGASLAIYGLPPFIAVFGLWGAKPWGRILATIYFCFFFLAIAASIGMLYYFKGSEMLYFAIQAILPMLPVVYLLRRLWRVEAAKKFFGQAKAQNEAV